MRQQAFDLLLVAEFRGHFQQGIETLSVGRLRRPSPLDTFRSDLLQLVSRQITEPTGAFPARIVGGPRSEVCLTGDEVGEDFFSPILWNAL